MLRNNLRRLAFESLEDRRLLAFAAEGSLVGIKGTKGDDVIRVEVIKSDYYGDMVELTLNGEKWAGRNPYDVDAVVILGLSGNDQITIADNVPFAALIDAGKGDDTITTNSADDIILGGAGKDTIFSRLGNDEIDGGAGNDIIDCGAGDDTARGGKGNDTIHGGNGSDILIGDAGIDALYGDDGDDGLGGGKGNDLIFGGNGADIIKADAGIDVCYGDDGNDVIDGGAGVDELHGGEDNDGLFGGLGNDTLFGDDDADHLDGGKGIDTCRGGDGDDQLKGGLGNDLLDGESGDNLLDLPEGMDVLANGITTDIDVEFRASIAAESDTSYVEYDVRNMNGQVAYVLRVTINNVTYSSGLPLVLIDGVQVGQVHTSNGSGEAEFSTDPTNDQGLLGSNFPMIHAGSTVLIDAQFSGMYGSMFGTRAVGTFVPAYVL
jgi:Ca2+-binding RTX toxin-like protein